MNEDPKEICEIHKVKMFKHTNEKGTWYSHKLDDGTWCNGGKKKMSGNSSKALLVNNSINATVVMVSAGIVPPADLFKSADKILKWSVKRCNDDWTED